jgi:hypothetical protein
VLRVEAVAEVAYRGQARFRPTLDLLGICGAWRRVWLFIGRVVHYLSVQKHCLSSARRCFLPGVAFY